MHTSNNWKSLAGVSSQDVTVLSEYLQSWRLKLSHSKMVTVAFRLNNREAKRELVVHYNYNLLSFCLVSTYLGVTLDRSLTFRHHIEALSEKLTSHVALLRRLASSGCGAGAKTLRRAGLSLLYSTSEYCTLVWCCSAYTHLIGNVLNDAMRIVNGCLHPTPTDYLPILAGIMQAELSVDKELLSLPGILQCDGY